MCKANQRFRLFLQQKGMCAICGEPMELHRKGYKKYKSYSATLDHIKRVREGGPGTLDNLRLTHKICNEIRN